MKNSYLVHRKTGSSYLFRSVVPLDLQPLFGTRQFQLSLGCGILGQSKILSFHLNTITQSIYDSIRKNPDMKIPTTDDIKEILKVELEKVETTSFTVNQIRVFHDTKCVLQCVQKGQMDGNSYQETGLKPLI